MSFNFPPRETKKRTIANMIKGKYIKVPEEEVSLPLVHEVPVDV